MGIRDATVNQVREILTDEPVSIASLAEVLGLTTANIKRGIRALLAANGCEETYITEDSHRVLAYTLPKKRHFIPAVREEYKGEPLPLRYIPRNVPILTVPEIIED